MLPELLELSKLQCFHGDFGSSVEQCQVYYRVTSSFGRTRHSSPDRRPVPLQREPTGSALSRKVRFPNLLSVLHWLRMPNIRLVSRPFFWLVVCLLISFGLIVYPVYVIYPFRYQGRRELATTLALIQVRPYLEILLVIAAVALAVIVWRRACRIRGKAAALIGAVLVVLFAGLSRINLYELMFHPLDAPTFSPASQAKLDGNEEVLAIQVGRTARAYPVRIISYHHIVNDVVDGVPIVATY